MLKLKHRDVRLTCPKSHTYYVVELRFEPKEVWPRGLFLCVDFNLSLIQGLGHYFKKKPLGSARSSIN